MSDASPDLIAKESKPETKPEVQQGSNKTEMSHILNHIKSLETSNNDLKGQLEQALSRNEKLSSKTRDGMRSALDTLLKRWMDAVETKDEKVKTDFRCGLEQLVEKSAEDNGVWQMMVSASELHKQQEHELEKFRTENNELRLKVDGMYATESSRTDNKRKAENELDRGHVTAEEKGGEQMWMDFASSIGQIY